MNAIEVEGLSYRYRSGRRALSDIGFSVAQGERVGLIGPNGAGKSTLLLHLNGVLPERPGEDGTVRILGTPVAPQTLPAIRAQVGLLFQDPDDQLFCPSVGEDVAFGPRQMGVPEAEVGSRVRDALEQVGLAGFEERAPHHLSLGEKHRACLAGLLACRARVLALDEPSSSLDPRGRRELTALLLALPATQIMATHDLELVVLTCSRVILLDGGRLIAQGPTARILNDEELMLRHGLERPHILRHAHPHK
jgi:cobalt/nickel transport system ATP-binding protein